MCIRDSIFPAAGPLFSELSGTAAVVGARRPVCQSNSPGSSTRQQQAIMATVRRTAFFFCFCLLSYSSLRRNTSSAMVRCV